MIVLQRYSSLNQKEPIDIDSAEIVQRKEQKWEVQWGLHQRHLASEANTFIPEKIQANFVTN